MPIDLSPFVAHQYPNQPPRQTSFATPPLEGNNLNQEYQVPTLLVNSPLIFIERAVSDINFVAQQHESDTRNALLAKLQTALSTLLDNHAPTDYYNEVPLAGAFGDINNNSNMDARLPYALLKNILEALYIGTSNNPSPFLENLLSGEHPLSAIFFPTQDQMNAAKSTHDTPQKMRAITKQDCQKADKGDGLFSVERFILAFTKTVWDEKRLTREVGSMIELLESLHLNNEKSLVVPLSNLLDLLG